MTSAFNAAELWSLTATEAVHLLKTKSVTPLQLVKAAATRIQATDTELNAAPIRCFEQATQIAASWQDFAKANSPGYLHGLPVLVKDLTAVKGLPFTEGSRIYKDRIAAANDALVDVLEDNGAIILGKTNTPEFGAGANTFNDVYGKTRNPWNTNLTAAGSSGGSAAALAAGQVWLATGSDLGGSLRTPASFCGVVGLRPSVGRVPQGSSLHQPAAKGKLQLHAVSGPMARNVPDLALFLDAMAHHHPKDPLSQPAPEMSYTKAVKQGSLPLPTAVAWTADIGICPVDPEVASLCEKAARWFSSVGANVVDACPDVHDAQELFQVLRADLVIQDPECKINMQEPRRSLLKPEVVWQLEKGFQQSSEQVAEAKRGHQQYVNRVLDFLRRFDLLCCPCAMVAPFDVDIRWIQEVEGTKFDNYVDWMMMAYVFSLVNVPVLCLPCGMTADGRPVGLQIVGKPQGEHALLAAAAAFERAHPYASMVPMQPVVKHLSKG